MVFHIHGIGDRTYFPDFYIESLDLYVEIKGYETERDRAKWFQFPHKLVVLKLDEINQIKNGTFSGLVYNKDFIDSLK
jgi:predicted nuclease of restriction endonuclease-like RecB superfamily